MKLLLPIFFNFCFAINFGAYKNKYANPNSLIKPENQNLVTEFDQLDYTEIVKLLVPVAC